MKTYEAPTYDEIKASISDEGSFNSLLKRYKGLMLYRARMFVGKIDGYDIDDLVQECSLVLDDCRRSYKGTADFSTYFTAAMIRRFISLYRIDFLHN